MNSPWVIAGACAATLGWLCKAVIGRMLQEEAETRLGRIPFAIIRLACARLPRELRDDMAAEWRAELHHVLHASDGMPLTRLLRGIRYSAGLLMSAPAIADSLRGSTRRLLRVARAIGAAGATAWAVWLLVYSYEYFHPQTQLIAFGWGPVQSPDQWTMTGVSYICAAAAFLCVGALLATGRWLIANLNGLCFIAAGVLSYLGGGPVYSIVVAAVVFCILVSTVGLQVSTRRRSRDAMRSARPA